MSVLFVCGIDTDIGKTYATGFLANKLQSQGQKVITQKLVQTGCTGIAEDLLVHRKMMNLPLQDVDVDGTTCPYVFPIPASPHLSSMLAGQTIDMNVVTQSTKTLLKKYDTVLLEGAGGLMVPIHNDLLIVDYIAQQGYSVILVTSGRLGSINHTLLSLDALTKRGIKLHTLVYNCWQDSDGELIKSNHANNNVELNSQTVNEQINNSTRLYLQNYLAKYFPQSNWLELPVI